MRIPGINLCFFLAFCMILGCSAKGGDKDNDVGDSNIQADVVETTDLVSDSMDSDVIESDTEPDSDVEEECVAQCESRQCGSSCGVSCGECEPGTACNADGQCEMCGSEEPMITGGMNTSVSSVVFDNTQVDIAHKRDIDEWEDGCISNVEISLSSGSGCRLNLVTESTFVRPDVLKLILVNFSADSFCPNFSDDDEGVYTEGSDFIAELTLGISEVPGNNVTESCFETTMTIFLSGTLVRQSGDPLEINSTEITLSGEFVSHAGTEWSCPCLPECGSKECGDNGCGGVCGECEQTEECDQGICTCVPDCSSRQCGLDPVCGTQSCGECQGQTEYCNQGECTDDCLLQECGNSPNVGLNCGTCNGSTDYCDNGTCRDACIGMECGNSPHGPNCGTCSGSTDYCNDGICIDPCSGLECGDSPHGPNCGTCSGSTDYCDNGTCRDACDGLECGDSPNGPNCGTCSGSNDYCDYGTCRDACEYIDCGLSPEGVDCGDCPVLYSEANSIVSDWGPNHLERVDIGFSSYALNIVVYGFIQDENSLVGYLDIDYGEFTGISSGTDLGDSEGSLDNALSSQFSVYDIGFGAEFGFGVRGMNGTEGEYCDHAGWRRISGQHAVDFAWLEVYGSNAVITSEGIIKFRIYLDVLDVSSGDEIAIFLRLVNADGEYFSNQTLPEDSPLLPQYVNEVITITVP